MRLPIRYALGDASRIETSDSPINFENYSQLTFETPDIKRFPALGLGHYALEKGGNTACIINAANEIAVDAFLHQQIRFTQIPQVVEHVLNQMDNQPANDLEAILQADQMARGLSQQYVVNKGS